MPGENSGQEENGGSPSEASLLLSQSPACQWLVDASHVFRQIYADPSALFGKPASELLGRTAGQALGPVQSAAWIDRFQRVFEGEKLILRERRGEATWYVSLFPVRKDTEILFAGGMAHEITLWGKADQELRRTVL